MSERPPKPRFEVIKGGKEIAAERFSEGFTSLPENLHTLIDKDAVLIKYAEMLAMRDAELLEITGRDDKWENDQANTTYAALLILQERAKR